jgi:hypothetical protein
LDGFHTGSLHFALPSFQDDTNLDLEFTENCRNWNLVNG